MTTPVTSQPLLDHASTSIQGGMQPTADDPVPTKISDRAVSEKTTSSGFISAEPSLVTPEQVSSGKKNPQSTSTIVLPSMPPIQAQRNIGDTNLKIASNQASDTKAGLVPVVTPVGDPKKTVETKDVETTFALPLPLTSTDPTRGGRLGAAINATAAIYGGKNPILPTGALGQQSTLSSRAKHFTQVSKANNASSPNNTTRLNKFVRRLHDMLQSEKDSGIVEWRRGLLVLHSTDAFAQKILPKYFNTRNFKTFRRQLNYYGFVHVRSFSATGSTTTALWVNQDLAKRGTKNISSVLMLKRVEPSEAAKTAEGRRVRKEEAVSTVEDIGISTRTLQLEQIRSLVLQRPDEDIGGGMLPGGALPSVSHIPMVVHCHAPLPVVPNPTPPSPPEQPESNSTKSTEAPTDESTDDAANLLLMLSKSRSI